MVPPIRASTSIRPVRRRPLAPRLRLASPASRLPLTLRSRVPAARGTEPLILSDPSAPSPAVASTVARESAKRPDADISTNGRPRSLAWLVANFETLTWYDPDGAAIGPDNVATPSRV